MINELESIVLLRDLPQHGLKVGDLGTAVAIWDGGRGYEIEFLTMSGETIAVETFPAGDVRPAEANEIAHVRRVA